MEPAAWVGLLALEIANDNTATIICDSRDVRSLYGLNKAHADYGLAGSLVFIRKKAGKYAEHAAARAMSSSSEPRLPVRRRGTSALAVASIH